VCISWTNNGLNTINMHSATTDDLAEYLNHLLIMSLISTRYLETPVFGTRNYITQTMQMEFTIAI